MTKYVIYLLQTGKCNYVGSSTNFKRRLAQHKKDLKENKHVNDFLQKEWNRTKQLTYKILLKGETLFYRQILLDEQRMINRYANANEAKASSYTHYTRKEFYYDMIDLIVNHWKLISAIIVTVLIVGYGMTQEQATQVIDFIVKIYNGG